MAERFRPGDRVRTRRSDPVHHTRLPRYAAGALGTVLDVQGHHPLPDERAQGRLSAVQPVYTVAFEARELFGAGEHGVRLALWESYLGPAGEGA